MFWTHIEQLLQKQDSTGVVFLHKAMSNTIDLFYHLTALIISLINNLILAVHRLFGLG